VVVGGVPSSSFFLLVPYWEVVEGGPLGSVCYYNNMIWMRSHPIYLLYILLYMVICPICPYMVLYGPIYGYISLLSFIVLYMVICRLYMVLYGFIWL
jgi:hypothetical protein